MEGRPPPAIDLPAALFHAVAGRPARPEELEAWDGEPPAGRWAAERFREFAALAGAFNRLRAPGAPAGPEARAAAEAAHAWAAAAWWELYHRRPLGRGALGGPGAPAGRPF